MYQINNTGWIEVITGPMYCGKSEELIRRLRRVEIARQKAHVFKPVIDNRYSNKDVVSHNGERIEAIPVNHPEEILQRIDKNTEVVGIDEVQFFSNGIISICEQLADEGKRVIVAGLDRDFRGGTLWPGTGTTGQG